MSSTSLLRYKRCGWCNAKCALCLVCPVKDAGKRPSTYSLPGCRVEEEGGEEGDKEGGDRGVVEGRHGED